MKRSFAHKIMTVFLALVLSFGICEPVMPLAFGDGSNATTSANSSSGTTSAETTSSTQTNTVTSTSGSGSQEGETEVSDTTSQTDQSSATADTSTGNAQVFSTESSSSASQIYDTSGNGSTSQVINIANLLSGDQVTVEQLSASQPVSTFTGISIGDTSYDTLEAAFTALNSMSGDVTIRIGGTHSINANTGPLTVSNTSGSVTLEGENNATITIADTRNNNNDYSAFLVNENATLTVNNVNIEGQHTGTDANEYLNWVTSNSNRGERAFDVRQNGTLNLTGSTTVEHFVKYVGTSLLHSTNENSHSSAGAGVLVGQGGTLNMSGTATISDCIAKTTSGYLTGGGGVALYNASLNMTGSSKITQCKAMLNPNGTVNVVGADNFDSGCGSAIIYERRSSNDGDAKTITITDNAEISYNEAHYGGTVYYSGDVTINISGNAQLVHNTNYGQRGAVLYADHELAGGGTHTLNMSGNACLSGNTLGSEESNNRIVNVTAGSAIGSRMTSGSTCTINLSDSVKINNNTNNAINRSGSSGGDVGQSVVQAIALYKYTRLNISGDVSICDNTTPNATYGTGILVWGNPGSTGSGDNKWGYIYLSGSPTITGNGTSGRESDVMDYSNQALQSGTSRSIIHIGQLTGGRVGFEQFFYALGVAHTRDTIAQASDANGTLVDAASNNTNNEFSHIFNTQNTNQYATAGTGSNLVWGTLSEDTGTCQIIRTENGTTKVLGPYLSLDYAAAEATHDGDIIEVYRSHTTNGTVWLNKNNVTVRPAPMDTPTVPADGTNAASHTRTEEKITITRNSTTTRPMIVAGRSSLSSTDDYDIRIENLTFNVGSTSDPSHPGFAVGTRLHLNDVTIQNYSSSQSAAVWVYDGTEEAECQDGVCYIDQVAGPGVLYVQGNVQINNNNGRDVALPSLTYSGAQIVKEGDLDDSTSIGVLLQNSNEYMVYRQVVRPNSSDINLSNDVNKFSDDTNAFPMDVNDHTGGQKTELDNRIYFGDAPLYIRKDITGSLGNKSQTFTINVNLGNLTNRHTTSDNVTITLYDANNNVVQTSDWGDYSASGQYVLEANGDGHYFVIHGLGPDDGTGELIGVSEPEYTDENSDVSDHWEIASVTYDGTAATLSSGVYQGRLKSASVISSATDENGKYTQVIITNNSRDEVPTGIGETDSDGDHSRVPLILLVACLAGGAAILIKKMRNQSSQIVQGRNK